MFSKTIFIESEKDVKKLEVYLSCESTQEQAPGIIIAHPYGPLGGNMRNNVVIALQKYFVSKGYVVACFNFRGCGRSEGRTSWTAMAERQDYLSVINFLLAHNQPGLPQINKLVLSGYSFGAMIANSIDCNQVPTRHLLVSIPLGVMWALATTKASFFKQKIPSNDTFCICGDRDQFTSANTVEKWYKNTICVKDADHFWFDIESILINHVNQWLQ